jgi:hypothetical protein
MTESRRTAEVSYTEAGLGRALPQKDCHLVGSIVDDSVVGVQPMIQAWRKSIPEIAWWIQIEQDYLRRLPRK